MRISLQEARDRIPQRDTILETTVRLMVPFIQLYGLYVIVHGHYSPGGGFQGGVVLGASVILFALAFGLPASKRYLSESTDIILANTGALIYTGIATLCALLGGMFLDYSALAKILPIDPISWHSHGIFLVEVGVGMGVTTIMVSIYWDMASAGRLDEGL
ncbi:MAG: Na(+)/H(+) antiporter subunit B [Desulfuromonadales bacterium]|nr:Na(+)/H(+) antiporter subunit B [Desulfuromonadales bacterium]